METKTTPKKCLIDTIVIPVGGESKRLKDYLKSINFDSTKTLIPINGIPLLKYIIDNVIATGYKKIYLLASYYEDDIEKFVKKYYHNNNCIYVIRGGKEGRKNGANKILSLVEDKLNQPFVYCDGDILVNKSLLKKLRNLNINKKTLIQCIISPRNLAQTHIKFIVEKNKLTRVTLNNKYRGHGQKYCSLGLMVINSNIFKKWPSYCHKKDLDYVIKEMFDRDRDNINYKIYKEDWFSVHYRKDVIDLKKGKYNSLMNKQGGKNNR